jgi:hypothetical protein
MCANSWNVKEMIAMAVHCTRFRLKGCCMSGSGEQHLVACIRAAVAAVLLVGPDCIQMQA